MKPLFAYILLSLLFSSAGCQMKKESSEAVKGKKEQHGTIPTDETSQTENDTLALLPVDTLSTAKEIRELISSFRDKPIQEISKKEKLIWENIETIWDRNDTVYITLIARTEDFIQTFKKYVIHSPRVVFPPKKASLRPPYEIQSDSTQFFMKVEPNVYPPTIDLIEIHITNRTQNELTAGADYLLEYYDGTNWVDVPQTHNFISLGYIIKPGKTRDFTASLHPQLSPNRIGQYRVWKTVGIRQGEKYENYSLISTFFISDQPEAYREYTEFSRRLHVPRPMAEYKGGETALKEFFRTHLRYPEKYKGTGTIVRLFYAFSIDSLGRLENPEARPQNIIYPLYSDDPYTEFWDEALRVLQLMPAWIPAVDRIHGPKSFPTGLVFIFKENDVSVQ